MHMAWCICQRKATNLALREKYDWPMTQCPDVKDVVKSGAERDKVTNKMEKAHISFNCTFKTKS